MPYPKRLIEVDLPIKRISAHARREKSIRHGHISTLHIWWARRPLAACRAVLCASLWPDPADELCPKEFIEFAKKEMLKWSDLDHLQLLNKESYDHFIKLNHDSKLVNNKTFLRQLLFDFIADFCQWVNSKNEKYIETARQLTKVATESLMGESQSKPLVVDPFAGGGSIPIESVRVGASTFASDINAIPVLLNKVQTELIPKFGTTLSEKVKYWGTKIQENLLKDLAKTYPINNELEKHSFTPQLEEKVKKDNAHWKFDSVEKEQPIAYLWVRTARCEGPSCGAKVPLMKSLWLSKKGKSRVAFKIVVDKKRKSVDLELTTDIKQADTGTVKKGALVCPVCGFTTAQPQIRRQIFNSNGGANSSQLIGIVTLLETLRTNGKKKISYKEGGRFYRLPNKKDLQAVNNSVKDLEKIRTVQINGLPIIADEETPMGGGKGAGRAFSQRNYGIIKWSELFNDRQLLTQAKLLLASETIVKEKDKELEKAVKTCLAFCVDTIADHNTSICTWRPTSLDVGHVFGRQAISISYDFAEINPISESTGSYFTALEKIVRVLERESVLFSETNESTVLIASALNHPLPDDSVDCFFTDPPYYDAIPYADLSDFFYVWLRRSLKSNYPELFKSALSNKIDECIVDEVKGKDDAYFESTMQSAMIEGRRILKPNGICVVVFANKTTEGWEAQLQAMFNAGWVFTASWPIDTESSGRLRAMNSAALASSVHLVCRPRENEDGSLIQNKIGDWRDVQEELPKRIHEWMPRLAEEGVAGADAIFACLGPALEIYSRYTKVVHAGSEREISLREYLEKVWAAVSQEALNMVFSGGDAQGLEEDARLTAMWLWTLTAGASDNGNADDEEESDEDESTVSGKLTGGFTLEYDTARKIAQGLGANLEDLKSLIEVKGDKARLLPVIERANKLFGATGIQAQAVKKKKKVQLSISFENVITEEDLKFEMPELKMEQTGKTVLDRLHQAMLLFSTGRSEALKRFLVEDGAGKDDRFWKLAQSLTSLYPKDTDERRWVEAVQTYKKSLGF